MTHIIHSGKDGELESTSAAEIDALFDTMKTSQKVVLHFHGGLVNEAGGRKVANALKEVYEKAGAQPVFFVWEAGLLEVVTHNLGEIFGEDFFKILLKYVTKFAKGKLEQATDSDGKAVGELQLMSDKVFYKELAKRNTGAEPFENVEIPDTVAELTPEEEADFKKTLAEDPDFTATVEAIVAAQHPEVVTKGDKGVIARVQASGRSLMDPEAVKALAEDNAAAEANGGKGLFESAKAIKAAVVILARVIKRFIQKRDHGVYPTIVEEILREFYVANAGGKVWHAMKKETGDTFGSGGKPRAGSYFMDKLEQLLANGKRPEITLVGHSTGAVFINNMLRDAAKRKKAGKLPADFLFKNVAFLAAACTMDDFATVTPSSSVPAIYENLRSFAMTDDAECDESLVPYLYTRSLLYFVSGVVERDSNGKGAYDQPLVGMERYHARKNVYDGANENSVRSHVAGHNKRAVWSPTKNGVGDGLRSGSTGHTKFDEDEQTLASLTHLIKVGY